MQLRPVDKTIPGISANPTSMRIHPARRRDIVAALLSALAVTALWANTYNFLGPQRFTDPITYEGDALFTAAPVAAARRGDFLPIVSKELASLGAPFVASWNDYPFNEDWIVFFTGLIARVVGVFGALNLMFLSACVAAALSMYFVARRFGVKREGALIAGLLYGVSNFILNRNVHHYFYIFYFTAPFNILVSTWLSSRKGIPFRSKRFSVAAITTILSAWTATYYVFFAAQLYVLGTIAAVFRRGKNAEYKSIAALACIFVLAVSLMHLDSVAYVLKHGPNSMSIGRAATDGEYFALKPLNLFIPPQVHKWPFMRTISQVAMRQTMINGEFPTSYAGLAGALGLIGLLFAFVRSIAQQRVSRVTGWGAMAAWLLVAHSVGGLNSAMGLLGMHLFRSTNRVSIFVIALGLLFFGWAVGQMLSIIPNTFRVALTAGVGLFFAIEQMYAQRPLSEVAEHRRLAESDRRLVQQMEDELDDGAMVFQLPAMHFPEAPAFRGVDGYELFRPTFYANTLRFSHGDVKGRPNAEWKFRVGAMPIEQMLAELRKAGFAALYLNRKGYADAGQSIVAGLVASGCRVIAEADARDSVAIVL